MALQIPKIQNELFRACVALYGTIQRLLWSLPLWSFRINGASSVEWESSRQIDWRRDKHS